MYLAEFCTDIASGYDITNWKGVQLAEIPPRFSHEFSQPNKMSALIFIGWYIQDQAHFRSGVSTHNGATSSIDGENRAPYFPRIEIGGRVVIHSNTTHMHLIHRTLGQSSSCTTWGSDFQTVFETLTLPKKTRVSITFNKRLKTITRGSEIDNTGTCRSIKRKNVAIIVR